MVLSSEFSRVRTLKTFRFRHQKEKKGRKKTKQKNRCTKEYKWAGILRKGKEGKAQDLKLSGCLVYECLSLV